jgi:hypothetical protein
VKYFDWDLPRFYAKGELSIFEDSDSKRFYSEPNVVEYKGKKQKHDFILGTTP